jgi:hypothetical protein
LQYPEKTCGTWHVELSNLMAVLPCDLLADYNQITLRFSLTQHSKTTFTRARMNSEPHASSSSKLFSNFSCFIRPLRMRRGTGGGGGGAPIEAPIEAANKTTR